MKTVEVHLSLGDVLAELAGVNRSGGESIDSWCECPDITGAPG